MHLPRSVFSHRQLDFFLWLLKVNRVDDVPSVKAMQGLNAALQKMCGIDTIAYNGALGHKYYVNSLPQIIAQEMANPNVRPHLSFYPEDSGKKLSEARQGERWLKEPAGHSDHTDGGQFFASCWAVTTDEHSGWRVIIKSEPYVVPAAEFLKNFPEFKTDANYYNVPDPTNIINVLDETSQETTDWTYTDPKVGNTWRAKAEGCRVVSFPLWMYCDDTSGNVSKKWNEHNSFLVTPAGLPREESQKKYNIHFLSTSNIAPPLEMLDGIVEQLEEAQKHGIWTWDVDLNEPVLVIPEVLALLGDNPMQSEFACHIGLRGKLFCRACWVKGTDALDPAGAAQSAVNTGDESDGGQSAGSANESDPSDKSDGSQAGSQKGKKRRKVKETLAQMVARVKAFVKIGTLRNKAETTEKLKSFFTEASTLDTKTKIQNQRTETGLKDTYQLFFLEKLFESYKNKKGRAAKQAALNARLAELPKITTSPGLILTKIHLSRSSMWFFWDLVVQLQLKNKDDKKELLITRLSSLDVSGLGISPLAGRTLVQYSGSLTGRDFRSIAQVAPFVVYDLVSTECFDTWQALSKLIPLIWQPEIEDIDAHIALLTKEIDSFLLHAARWTNLWFNKPKFHIILHLPAHIRRFGPAILFATEAFESFDAIIRAKSVHSNRHAPSRDIAQAFAQGNRIRHLLSGGLFLLTSHSTDAELPLQVTPKFSKDRNLWKTVGAGPKHLVESPNTITSYLGLDSRKEPAQGVCTLDKIRARQIRETLIGQHIPEWSSKSGLFRTCEDIVLKNGDVCLPGSFFIIQHPNRIGETFVGRVEEIIQAVGSIASHAHGTDGILVHRLRPRYGMPTVIMSGERKIYTTNHNCMDNQCGPTGLRPVYQERQLTDQTRALIAHSKNPTDLVLNTAQMRDALHLQRFRIDTQQMNTDTIIHQSAVSELAASAKADAVQKTQRKRSNAPATSVRVENVALARVRQQLD
ncbi:hypothetical protein B0H14DRAFT_2585305 [Mycena olivaceomarginata]|nr:hypothetical protein B0H14DRAFT_2585305 [Mycena olivaceomarginata]